MGGGLKAAGRQGARARRVYDAVLFVLGVAGAECMCCGTGILFHFHVSGRVRQVGRLERKSARRDSWSGIVFLLSEEWSVRDDKPHASVRRRSARTGGIPARPGDSPAGKGTAHGAR